MSALMKQPQSREADQCNYRTACGMAQASDALKTLMDHGVAVYNINIEEHKPTLTTSNARHVAGVRVMSSHTQFGKKVVRAIWETCVLQWEETTCH